MKKLLNKKLFTYVCVLSITLTFLLSIFSLWKCHDSSNKDATTTSAGMNTVFNHSFSSNDAPHLFGNTSQNKQHSIGKRSQNQSSSAQKNKNNSQNDSSQDQMMTPHFGSSNNTNSTQSKLPFMLYSGLFFILLIGTFFLIHKQKALRFTFNTKLSITTLLLSGLFIRLAISPWVDGQPFDLNFFKTWASAASNGLSTFYSSTKSDYPPFYMYVLFIVGKIHAISGMSTEFTVLVKLPSIVADIVTSYLLYRIARKKLQPLWSIIIAAFYLFNPAVIINSTFWGQVDSFFTMLLVFAIYLLTSKKIIISTIVFTLAVLMKPQGIIFLPVLFFELVRLRNIRIWIGTIATSMLTAAIVVLPFWGNQNAFWVLKLYSSTVGEYPYASVNAYNFFGLIGANYISDSTKFLFLTYHQWGMICIVLTTAFAWFTYWRVKSSNLAFLVGTILIAGTFTFSTSMHERYLFPAAALAILAFCYIKDQRLLWLAGGYSLTIFINTFEVYYGTFEGLTAEPYALSLIFTSLLNVLLLVLLIKTTWDTAMNKKKRVA